VASGECESFRWRPPCLSDPQLYLQLLLPVTASLMVIKS
jgi:hypothetical protein